LVTIEDLSVLHDFDDLQAKEPMARKVYEDRVIYRSNGLFGLLKREKFGHIWPKITDFGLAQRCDRKEPLVFPIQPTEYHAPEVLLGAGWSYSADIWNFGLVVM
jgi:serine/threonine protein kinase